MYVHTHILTHIHHMTYKCTGLGDDPALQSAGPPQHQMKLGTGFHVWAEWLLLGSGAPHFGWEACLAVVEWRLNLHLDRKVQGPEAQRGPSWQ